MTDYEWLEQKIRDGMYVGNRHKCRRDIGRLVGGHLAAGRISAQECEELGKICISLSTDGNKTGTKEWNEAVKYGQQSPLQDQYRPVENDYALGWDSEVSGTAYKVIDENWIAPEYIEQPKTWNPCAELADYINLLFQPEDYVAFCTNPFQREGKWIPSEGTYTKKAKDIIAKLKKGKMDEAVGTLNKEAGAWIRINPFDGNGVKDINVTDYRYALVESDGMEIEKQVAIYKELELPCVAIVSSGGKSAHAIVKVFANSLEEYRKRVDFLYQVCENNGLPVDKQNRNPSRYSRMPGVMRNGNKQFIIERGCGKAQWDEWENYIKDLNDNLPDFEPIEDIENPPLPAAEQIEGVLRVGHKMCLVAPSKMGKSFMLINLTISVAEGAEWLGHKCRQGKVLYINLELDKNSCLNRFTDVYHAMGIPPAHYKDFIRIWHLRGRALPLDKLAPKLIRRAEKEGFAMIIFDPIYKILTGDENSASEMAAFCNNFDRVARDCGCSIVYAHHHSKGAQSGKRSMDRASGSGVFARDPDAMIDFIPLTITDSCREQYRKDYECEAMLKTAEQLARGYELNDLTVDDKLVPNKIMAYLNQRFDPVRLQEVWRARNSIINQFASVSGWRASFTLREFATPPEQNVWFRYPLHQIDDVGLLADMAPEGEQTNGNTSVRHMAERKKQQCADKVTALKNLVEFNPESKPLLEDVASNLKVSAKTVRRYCKELGYSIVNGMIYNESEY